MRQDRPDSVAGHGERGPRADSRGESKVGVGEELAHFVNVAETYGYILGSAEENATVGITIPGFAQ